jgi:hypothetical protein
MMGRWVFDCGHPPYNTEFHPTSAVAFSRVEPTIFQGDIAPSPTVKTYFYIHGRGGYYDVSIPVAGKDYAVNLIMPFIGGAELKAQIDIPPYLSQNPSPIVIPAPPIHIPFLFGFSIQPIHVVYPLQPFSPSSDNKFGSVISVGWREPIISQGYRLLKITFDSIQVNNDHDGIASGEWNNLWASVNGHWIELSGPNGHFGLDDVNNGQRVNFNDRSVIVLVPESGILQVHTSGWESDGADDVFGANLLVGALAGLVDNNQPIGVINKVYSISDPSLIGPHNELSQIHQERRPDTNEDYILTFHIDELARYPQGSSVR